MNTMLLGEPHQTLPQQQITRPGYERSSLDSLHSQDADLLRLVCYQLHWPLVALGFLLACWADRRAPADYASVAESAKAAPQLRPCPETHASFLNQLTFWWFNPLAVKVWSQ